MEEMASSNLDRLVEKENPNSIKLPETIEVFRNLKNAKRFAIDIGGSLTKIAYFSTVSHRRVTYEGDSSDKDKDPSKHTPQENFSYESKENARLHFVKFETKYIDHCLDFIAANLINSDGMEGKSIKATGGGAYKYANLIQSKLGLSYVTNMQT
uniref:Pantothenate kinase 4 n=1 Tax=Cacopsylla melanoneura TaxID=428564 RepID=A0A8D8PNP2_9HEMI